MEKIELMYRKPGSSYNQKANDLYNKNIFSVMEEVYHKEGERIDLVIFLNGLAIITFELKCNTSGQNYEDAIWQYRKDRDYKTRLFSFKSGALVNFAMDLNEVYMCTHLKGKSSYFLPFNKGTKQMGKGNPHNENGLRVSYMWEDILKKDVLISLIEKFIFIKHEEKENATTGKIEVKESLIFPRYHQLDAVRKLTQDIKNNKTEYNYLIEHSAGSGKTNTIAWLAHRLVPLRDNNEKSIFDSIIIITDRIIVDRQLQDAIMGIEHQAGLVSIMDDKCNSSDLANALNGNTKIIVSTIQKFRYILDEVRNLKDKNFAIIIDEAHSSTTGKNMMAVTTALSSDEEDEDVTVEDLISEEIRRSGKQKNVSMIAFTATQKNTTLEIFGTPNENGKKEAFHLYSMKQAIEEGFILNVLENYVTYDTFYKLNKKGEYDPLIKTSDAKRKIKMLIDLNDENIRQKVEIIVEHFKNHIMHQLGGKAKAMVVTSSRKGAVKYKKAFEEYINEKGYQNIRALVAFSGKVMSNDGEEYTEVGINGFSEEKLRSEFDKQDYQILIVANKYQTGFDQPKLMAMYIVDKKLRDVTAVQTLSRLNRIYPPFDKKTFILDFKNSYEDIQNAFAPYFKETILGEAITPSRIYEIEKELTGYEFLNNDDIDTFIELASKSTRTIQEKEKMWSLLDKCIQIIDEYDEAKKYEIKSEIRKFIKFYTYLIQITDFEDIDLHKKYIFLTYLVKEIDVTSTGNGFDIEGNLVVTNFEQKKTGEYNNLELEAKPVLSKLSDTKINLNEQKMVRLSEIIDEINNNTGKKLNVSAASDSLSHIKDTLLKSESLKVTAQNNPLSDFRFSYYDNVDNALLNGLEQNKELFTLLLNNEEFKKQILGLFMDDIYEELKKRNSEEE